MQISTIRSIVVGKTIRNIYGYLEMPLNNELNIAVKKIEKMLLPEMLIVELRNLKEAQLNEHEFSSRMLKGRLTFNEIFESELPAVALIECLQERIEKTWSSGCEISIKNNDGSQLTELGLLEENIQVICTLMTTLRKSFKQYHYIEGYLEKIIVTAFMMGFYSGSHDMKVNLENHALDGYSDRLIKPKASGKRNADKYLPMKSLILSMVDCFNKNKIGRASNSKLAEAIFDLIVRFSTKVNYSNLPALKVYKHNAPTKRNIDEIISGKNTTNSNKTLKQLSHNKIVELLTKSFTDSKIKSILINH